jgi:hypothetical protein
MVPTPLVATAIQDGRALAETLRAQGAPITGAYWLYTLERVYAKLYIVSPSVDTAGLHDMYSRIRQAFSMLGHTSLSLTDTSIISPRDRFVEALRRYLKRSHVTGEHRITGATFDNVLVDDMYVYWLD